MDNERKKFELENHEKNLRIIEKLENKESVNADEVYEILLQYNENIKYINQLLKK
jgi:hypothetical protein